MCYVTDVEHRNDELDSALIDFIRDSNVFIYDSTFDDANFAKFEGWGHSTWQEGVRLCTEANVKRLAIFHHDPDHEDDKMEEIECKARDMWDGAFVARENVRLVL